MKTHGLQTTENNPGYPHIPCMPKYTLWIHKGTNVLDNTKANPQSYGFLLNITYQCRITSYRDKKENIKTRLYHPPNLLVKEDTANTEQWKTVSIPQALVANFELNPVLGNMDPNTELVPGQHLLSSLNILAYTYRVHLSKTTVPNINMCVSQLRIMIQQVWVGPEISYQQCPGIACAAGP